MEITTLNQAQLKELAKEFYFKLVEREDWRRDFLTELEKREVIDKRDEGFYCSYCSVISKKAVAFVELNKTIFPRNSSSELWIVNSHYDGCRGWD